jgi:hypothetical protein
MLKNGVSFSDIKTSTLSQLSFLLNLLIEYAKEEEKLIKKSEDYL